MCALKGETTAVCATCYTVHNYKLQRDSVEPAQLTLWSAEAVIVPHRIRLHCVPEKSIPLNV